MTKPFGTIVRNPSHLLEDVCAAALMLALVSTPTVGWAAGGRLAGNADATSQSFHEPDAGQPIPGFHGESGDCLEGR